MQNSLSGQAANLWPVQVLSQMKQAGLAWTIVDSLSADSFLKSWRVARIELICNSMLAWSMMISRSAHSCLNSIRSLDTLLSKSSRLDLESFIPFKAETAAFSLLLNMSTFRFSSVRLDLLFIRHPLSLSLSFPWLSSIALTTVTRIAKSSWSLKIYAISRASQCKSSSVSLFFSPTLLSTFWECSKKILNKN